MRDTAHPINGVLALSGYGLVLKVERGYLVVEDGVADERRCGRFSRIDGDLERVVVFGRSGTVTLDALGWMHDLGIPFVQIDHDGDLITVGASRTLSDVRVRRGQAYAATNGVGLQIVRDLLAAKLHGQYAVAADLDGDPKLLGWIRDAEDALPSAASVQDLRLLESRAADAYWQAWKGVEVHFPASDRRRVPAHWISYDGRGSVLSDSPRKATNPINAILNYLYAILAAEATLALLRVGADPGIGMLHADSRQREGFAYDLVEAVRPDVDAHVLELARNHTFAYPDFFETREGVCRIMPALAKPLAATAPRWAELIAPHAERIAGIFATTSTTPGAEPVRHTTVNVPERFRTPLTNANRKRSDGGSSVTLLRSRCRSCGSDLGRKHRKYCNECQAEATKQSAAKGRAKLRRLKAESRDARSTKQAREKSRRAAERTNAEIAAWEEENGGDWDPAVYEEEIAPKVRHIPTEMIREATGLSTVYCGKIRRGKRTPHARHWQALRSLIKDSADLIEAGELPDNFWTERVAPRIAAFTAKRISDASGLSMSYCKRIRRGEQVPEKRYWPAIFRLLDSRARATE